MYLFDSEERREQREKDAKNTLYSRKSSICRCGVCGASNMVYREIVKLSDLLNIREERYHCHSCDCVDFIRMLPSDEKIPETRDYLQALKCMIKVMGKTE